MEKHQWMGFFCGCACSMLFQPSLIWICSLPQMNNCEKACSSNELELKHGCWIGLNKKSVQYRKHAVALN